MSYVIIVASFLCGYKIYKSRGQQRFDWFICCMLLFSSAIVLIQKPQLPCHRFFMLCYGLSIWANHEYKNRKFPLVSALTIYAAGILLVGIQSEFLTPFYKVYKPFALLLDSYIVLLVGYYGCRNEALFSKPIVNTFLLVTLYGVVTFAMMRNPLTELVHEAFNIHVRDDYYFGSRIRINSTWSHSISWGFICSAFFYAFLQYASRVKIRFLLFLLMLNIFLCGSRTALAAFILMGAVVIMMRYKLKRSMQVAFSALGVAVLAYLFVPMVQEKVDSVVLTALGQDTEAGSSLDMREGQTEATMAITAEKPLMGHGIDYIGEQMGYGTDHFTGDSRLFGFESYAYIILIERGFFGLALEIFIVIALLMFAVKHRRFHRTDSSYILSLLLGFVFFSLATGTLDTTIPTMFLIGLNMSRVTPPSWLIRVKNYFCALLSHRTLKPCAI